MNEEAYSYLNEETKKKRGKEQFDPRASFR